jgi:ribose transport system permease protein
MFDARHEPASTHCGKVARRGFRHRAAVSFAVNLLLNPARFQPSAWGALIGLAAPLIGAALARRRYPRAGRGGIDISVGPLMGFVNAIVIQLLFLSLGISSPLVIVPAAL